MGGQSGATVAQPKCKEFSGYGDSCCDRQEAGKPCKLTINGLSGHLCHIEAATDWEVTDVKLAICQALDIDPWAQRLVAGTHEVNDGDYIGELACTTLTLVRKSASEMQEEEERSRQSTGSESFTIAETRRSFRFLEEHLRLASKGAAEDSG